MVCKIDEKRFPRRFLRPPFGQRIHFFGDFNRFLDPGRGPKWQKSGVLGLTGFGDRAPEAPWQQLFDKTCQKKRSAFKNQRKKRKSVEKKSKMCVKNARQTQDQTIQNKTRKDNTRQEKRHATQGETRQAKPSRDKIRQNNRRQAKTRQDTKQIRQDKPDPTCKKQKTSQAKTRPQQQKPQPQ